MEEDDRPLWGRLLYWVVVPPLCALHFLACVYCMLRYRTVEKRVAFYEYYARWGWGDR